MSEKTTKKRAVKTKDELVTKLVDNNIEAFKKDLAEVEAKHGYMLEPVMYFSKMGVFPQIEVVKKETKKEDVV